MQQHIYIQYHSRISLLCCDMIPSDAQSNAMFFKVYLQYIRSIRLYLHACVSIIDCMSVQRACNVRAFSDGAEQLWQ